MNRLANGVAMIAAGMVVLVSPVPQANAQSYTLDQVLAKMGEVGRTFRSLEASIERTKVDVIVKLEETELGKVFFKRTQTARPQIKFEFTKPAYTVVIIEGVARVYNPRTKQVQEYGLGKDHDPAEFLLIGFGQSDDQIRQTYNSALVGEESVNGQRTTVIELKPKSTQVGAIFNSIRLWIDHKNWIPLQTKATEPGAGNYQIAKFTNIKLNGDIKDSVFKLNQPKDVQIIK